MEFHVPFSDKEIDVFDKINKTHYLIHFHGNNCCGVRNHMGVNIPNVFECTFLHKRYFTNVPDLNSDLIPSNLDMKNTRNDEIFINYKPFVHRPSVKAYYKPSHQPEFVNKRVKWRLIWL